MVTLFYTHKKINKTKTAIEHLRVTGILQAVGFQTLLYGDKPPSSATKLIHVGHYKC